MKIAAGILAYNEHPSMVGAALDSVDCLDHAFTFGADELIDNEQAEAQARQRGLETAAELGCDWYLQIDADERLACGERLYEYLPQHGAGLRWWPLPYVQEGGWTTVAPCKLIRLGDVRCLLASDVYEWGPPAVLTATAFLLSGFSWPTEYDSLLAGLPRLLHVPSERPDAGSRRRLSVAIEGSDQAGRIGAYKPPLPWIIPPARAVAFQAMSETLPPDERAEWQAGDGAYYCPECGRRYETAGLCEGTSEAGHPPAAVEKVTGGGNGGGGWPTSHAGVDAIAKEHNLPDWHEGKGGPTVADKIAALEAAGVSPGEAD